MTRAGIGVDIEEVENRLAYEGITDLQGSSISNDMVNSISEIIEPAKIVSKAI